MRKVSKKYLVILGLSFVLCLIIWFFALWYTRVRLDYRTTADSGFVALRLATQAGVSFQWSEGGQSIWIWRGDDNRRLWPRE
jgi:hypothetical protein